MKAEEVLKLSIDRLNKTCFCKWDMPLSYRTDEDLAEVLESYAFQKHIPDIIEHINGESQFIIVGYDYTTDDLSEEESDKAHEDSEAGWRVITMCMATLGYEPIDDVDGSGGGLNYGAILYKKLK